MIKNVSNLGDAAIYCDFGSEVNQSINSNVIDYFNYITNLVKEKKIEGINNLTPSYNKLIISFDLSITSFSKLKKIIENLDIKKSIKKKNQEIKIPVCCDNEYGLDFDRLSKKLNLSKEKILKLYFDKVPKSNEYFFSQQTGILIFAESLFL